MVSIVPLYKPDESRAGTTACVTTVCGAERQMEDFSLPSVNLLLLGKMPLPARWPFIWRRMEIQL